MFIFIDKLTYLNNVISRISKHASCNKLLQCYNCLYVIMPEAQFVMYVCMYVRDAHEYCRSYMLLHIIMQTVYFLITNYICTNSVLCSYSCQLLFGITQKLINTLHKERECCDIVMARRRRSFIHFYQP